MIKNFKVGSIELIPKKNAYILETGNIYGNMNDKPKFYQKNLSQEEIRKIFLEKRLNIGKLHGFDGKKMFFANQNDKKGTYKEITKEMIETTEDGFYTNIDEDILVLNGENTGVVIGHPVGDCAVVMGYDRRQNIAAIAHCGAPFVDWKLPISVIDALAKSYNSRDEDITTYVSACAGQSWIYDRYPKWAHDEKFWHNFIKEDENGLFHIDLKKAILTQLQERNIKDIIISPTDTIVDELFYSHSAFSHGKQKKKGRHFAGIYFKKENNYKK